MPVNYYGNFRQFIKRTSFRLLWELFSGYQGNLMHVHVNSVYVPPLFFFLISLRAWERSVGVVHEYV